VTKCRRGGASGSERDEVQEGVERPGTSVTKCRRGGASGSERDEVQEGWSAQRRA